MAEPYISYFRQVGSDLKGFFGKFLGKFGLGRWIAAVFGRIDGGSVILSFGLMRVAGLGDNPDKNAENPDIFSIISDKF